MENEIKGNEFVRYKDGDIIQIFQKIDQEYVIKDNKDRIYTLSESVVYKDMVKHSSNIIDLIKCGDYVNGRLVLQVDYKNRNVCLLIPFTDTMANTNIMWYGYEDIKNIATKEIMESISYKVKE